MILLLDPFQIGDTDFKILESMEEDLSVAFGTEEPDALNSALERYHIAAPKYLIPDRNTKSQTVVEDWNETRQLRLPTLTELLTFMEMPEEKGTRAIQIFRFIFKRRY